jgi:simple sugar transport system permease protein
LVAALVGLVMGLLMAFVSVTLKAEQGISGIGLSLFGLALSSLLFERWVTSLTSINGFQPVRIPILGSIPYIGDTFFNHSVLVYIAFLLVPVSSYIFSHTTLGLKIRAVGQHPQAADSVGISVVKIRYLTVSFGGLMAGIAGASLPLALISLFQENMTNGMGYIAVALVYFGGWRPRGVLGGSLLFSFVNAFQLWMQVKGVKIPSNIALMMPYVLTILALTFAVNRARQPAALDKPFERGES